MKTTRSWRSWTSSRRHVYMHEIFIFFVYFVSAYAVMHAQGMRRCRSGFGPEGLRNPIPPSAAAAATMRIRRRPAP